MRQQSNESIVKIPDLFFLNETLYVKERIFFLFFFFTILQEIS